VDEVVFDCPDCGQHARRIPDLIDVWYDSGAMPFAQHGYPHHDVETFRRRFPADFIAEAVDQTRGWFYTLMAEGVCCSTTPSYRNVVCHGHIVDADGRKMSKIARQRPRSLGAVLPVRGGRLPLLLLHGGPPGREQADLQRDARPGG
jgi:isoleucyl-tRNA synthetase